MYKNPICMCACVEPAPTAPALMRDSLHVTSYTGALCFYSNKQIPKLPSTTETNCILKSYNKDHILSTPVGALAEGCTRRFIMIVVGTHVYNAERTVCNNTNKQLNHQIRLFTG